MGGGPRAQGWTCRPTLHSARSQPYPAERLAELVSARLERRAVIGRVYLTVIIDQHVTQRLIGSAAVMAEQCGHLADLAERPDIALHVIAESVNVGLWGAFDIAARDGAVTVRLETIEDIPSTAPALVGRSRRIPARQRRWPRPGFLAAGGQLVDGDHRETPVQRETLHRRTGEHMPVRAHHLADGRHRGQARGLAQCQRSLGVTPADHEPFGPGGQREHMPGPQKVIRAGIGVGQAAHGRGPLVGGHTRARADGQIH